VERRAVYIAQKPSTNSDSSGDLHIPLPIAKPKYSSQTKASDAPGSLSASTDSDEQELPPKKLTGEVWNRTQTQLARELEGNCTVEKGEGDLDLEKGIVVSPFGRGLSVLRFEPVVLTFQDICYFVDLPQVCPCLGSTDQGIKIIRLCC
jgi:hypothetical protein